MRRCSPIVTAVSFAILTASLLSATACRDSDPPLAYNSDLASEANPNVRLLPTLVGYHAAHDASITQGNTRATIVRLDEFDPANVPVEPEKIAAGETPDLGEAESVADAMSKVGGAFLGNLLGGSTSGGAVEGGETPPVASTPPTSDAPSGSIELAAEDAATIQSLLTRYNETRSTRKFADMPVLSVEAQRSLSLAYYTRVEELAVSLNNVLGSYDNVQPGFKDTATAQLNDALAPLEISALSGVDSDTATATITAPQKFAGQTLTFRRDGGGWNIEDPYLPTADTLSDVKGTLTDAIDELDSLDDDLAEGNTVSADTANEAVAQAIKLIAGS